MIGKSDSDVRPFVEKQRELEMLTKENLIKLLETTNKNFDCNLSQAFTDEIENDLDVFRQYEMDECPSGIYYLTFHSS